MGSNIDWLLERSILSERMGWQILPHEMDEMDPYDLNTPLYLLRLFRSGQVMGEDIEKATEEILEIKDYVEELRSKNGNI